VTEPAPLGQLRDARRLPRRLRAHADLRALVLPQRGRIVLPPWTSPGWRASSASLDAASTVARKPTNVPLAPLRSRREAAEFEELMAIPSLPSDTSMDGPSDRC
jgi:hypothetical protein